MDTLANAYARDGGPAQSPADVELMTIAQINSERSRPQHSDASWNTDGMEKPYTSFVRARFKQPHRKNLGRSCLQRVQCSMSLETILCTGSKKKNTGGQHREINACSPEQAGASFQQTSLGWEIPVLAGHSPALLSHQKKIEGWRWGKKMVFLRGFTTNPVE